MLFNTVYKQCFLFEVPAFILYLIIITAIRSKRLRVRQVLHFLVAVALVSALFFLSLITSDANSYC